MSLNYGIKIYQHTLELSEKQDSDKNKTFNFFYPWIRFFREKKLEQDLAGWKQDNFRKINMREKRVKSVINSLFEFFPMTEFQCKRKMVQFLVENFPTIEHLLVDTLKEKTSWWFQRNLRIIYRDKSKTSKTDSKIWTVKTLTQ